jgi:hypothetical protein
VLIVITVNASAQEIYTLPGRPDEHQPSAVLVQLRTGERLLRHLEKGNNARRVAIVKADVDRIQKITVADFTTNFEFCPVYFFYDTSWSRIVNKEFEGVLLDRELREVHNLDSLINDTTYFIMTYGEEEGDREFKKQTLLANDYKGRQLSHRLPYKPYRNFASKYYGYYKRYSYVSKDFYLEYRGYAKAYNSTLHWFYSNSRHLK